MSSAALILADDSDLHADAVIGGLRAAGVQTMRLHPAALSEIQAEYELSVCPKRGRSAFLQCHGQKIVLGQIGAVFCRAWALPEQSPEMSQADCLSVEERRAGIRYLLKSIPPERWINWPWAEDLFDDKIRQAQLAVEHGLSVPETLMTKSPDGAKAFWQAHGGKIIIKQLSDVSLTDERSESELIVHGFYTSRVTEADLDYFDQINVAPCLLQRFIEKTADIRVNCVDGDVISYQINSQQIADSSVDFRRVPALQGYLCPFPDVVGKKLLALLRSQNIRFAACDFALGKDGVYYFLEANVQGNWLWLESPESSPTTDAVVAAMLKTIQEVNA